LRQILVYWQAQIAIAQHARLMAEEGYSILNWVPSTSGSKLGERLSIRVLKSAVSNARLGREEELGALKRLDAQARLLEHHASGPPVEKLIAEERERSDSYGGRCGFWMGPGGIKLQQ
jgi:hypothetical protein